MKSLAKRAQAPGRPTPKLRLGSHAKDYDILSILGRGAFGTAYLVKRVGSGDLLVLKCIDLTMMDPASQANALNECEVLNRLRESPSVIEVYEHFEHNGRCRTPHRGA